MATTPRPKQVIECHPECKLHPDKIGADKAALLKDIFEAGFGQPTFRTKGEVIVGFPITSGVAQRHFTHYKPAATARPEPTGARVPHIEILEEIIQRGFQNSKAWKPSIKDTLDAIKEFRSLTGGSAFEDMLKAMSEASGDEDDEESEAPEAVEAVLSPDERPVGEPDE